MAFSHLRLIPPPLPERKSYDVPEQSDVYRLPDVAQISEYQDRFANAASSAIAQETPHLFSDKIIYKFLHEPEYVLELFKKLDVSLGMVDYSPESNSHIDVTRERLVVSKYIVASLIAGRPILREADHQAKFSNEYVLDFFEENEPKSPEVQKRCLEFERYQELLELLLKG